MKDRRRNRNGWVPVTSQLEEEYMGGVESLRSRNYGIDFYFDRNNPYMRFRQEITVWDKAPTTPNHTYITEGSYLIGIVPEGTKEAFMFSSPKKQWSVSRRKFRDLTAKEKRVITGDI